MGCCITQFVGRLCLAAIFFTGLFKFTPEGAAMEGLMASSIKNVTGFDVPAEHVPLLFKFSAALEVLGALAVVLNFRCLAGLCLLGFMIPVTGIMHAFWKIEDPEAQKHDMIAFLKNLAIIGGIILYSTSGCSSASSCSPAPCDKKKKKHD
eukprot:TRINITY_DN2340_c0_g1::TRINITY_DN2340_c0_g1_i1::g.20672::m.20672 TRINITY_DN2340_c0_g1::TRINITY_DN2340_c0_g1_i1::g.20672  ORF type:complete len:165 (+),score=48.74,HR_lesion/PF05514.6/8.3e-05,SURF4/PF02077.10/1e+03,SURF4/PF02077.10/0.008,PepSY_TM_3/PF13706.1/1.4e+02,PepSY_TM_3/PF13706.1/2,PepSY_TM_3/PF13706.1/3.2e+03 TRINITY_DN2340_c0_g1_i1:43-495(+)